MIQKEWSLPGNLEQVMQSMTHREYLLRLAWIEESWSIPDRTDHYLMQIAQEVRRVLSKSPNRIQMKDFEVKFVSKDRKVTAQEKEKSVRTSKSTWFVALGISGKK